MVPARIAVLAAVLTSLPVAADTAALTAESLFRDIRAASRLPDAPADARRHPGSVRVFDAADLERMGARTLAEAVGRMPGVVLYNQAGNPYQPTLDMRGWNASPAPATVVVVDGVRVNEADLGQVNWQLIALDAVERVEVYLGPQTAYGKDAVAGVVAVFTRRGGRGTEASASVGSGSYGRADAQASVRGAARGVDYAVTGGHAREDGFRRGASSRMTNVAASVGRRSEAGDLRLAYAFADDRLDQGGSLTQGEFEADPRQRVSIVKSDSLLHGLAVSGRRRVADGVSASGLGFYRERLEYTPLNRGRTSTSRSRALLRAAGGAGQLVIDRDAWGRRARAEGGVEGGRWDAESSSAGDFSGTPFRSASGTRDTRLGSWLTGSFEAWPDGPSLTAGARWDRTTIDYKNRVTPANDGLRSYARTSPQVGFNWPFAGGAQLRGSYAEAFRAPTAGELSALGPFSSSPDLRPVKTRAWEAGAGWTHPDYGAFEATVFRALTRDEIYAVYDPGAGYGQNRNIDLTRRQGVELSLRPRVGPVDAWAEWSYTEATFQTDFSLDKAPFPATQRVTKGSEIPMVPRRRLVVGTSTPLPRGLRMGAQGQCVGASRFFGDEANLERRLPGYCTLDLDASFESGSWTLSLAARNALDEGYATRGILSSSGGRLERFVVPAAGRTFYANVKWRFSARP